MYDTLLVFSLIYSLFYFIIYFLTFLLLSLSIKIQKLPYFPQKLFPPKTLLIYGVAAPNLGTLEFSVFQSATHRRLATTVWCFFIAPHLVAAPLLCNVTVNLSYSFVFFFCFFMLGFPENKFFGGIVNI